MTWLLLAALVCPVVWPCRVTNAHTGKLIRRHDALVCFARSQGQRYPRKGYVVDHVKALACGGCDRPENMQFQTIIEGKAKDRWELIGCKVNDPLDHGTKEKR